MDIVGSEQAKSCRLELFFPKTFLEGEVEHIHALNKAGQNMGDPAAFRPEAEKRIGKKRKGLIISFLVVAVLVVLGFFTAVLVNRYFPLSPLPVHILRVGSFALIAWAVLGRLGYESESIRGNTLLEITSEKAFKYR